MEKDIHVIYQDLQVAIEKILLQKGQRVDLKNTTPLFSSGLMDSISGVELIVFLEKKYHFDFFADDLQITDIDSIAQIIGIIEGRKS